jgi:uncharacterized protein
LIVTAVRGHETLPRHHGRLQATIVGEKTAKGIVPAHRRPRPNAAVHLVPSGDVSEILNLEGDLRLGLLNGHDDVEIRVDSKKKSILPRHTAHIGTTGGGKSTGVGRTIAELQKAGTCVIVFDVEGEYTALNEATNDAGLVEVLEQRGLHPEGVPNTHVYRLCGCAPANPKHPSSKEFCLQFDQISPFAFGEIMDLSDAQYDRLIQAYEIVKSLMRDLRVTGEREVLDIDEFDRGWPRMRLDDLRYIVSGVLAISDKIGQEPNFTGSQLTQWDRARQKIYSVFGGDSDGDGENKTKSKSSPKFGNTMSWKALMQKIGRLTRLGIFDRGDKYSLDYQEMMAARSGQYHRPVGRGKYGRPKSFHCGDAARYPLATADGLRGGD